MAFSASTAPLRAKLNHAQECEDDNRKADAITSLEWVISYEFPSSDDVNEDNVKMKEQAAYKLAGIFFDLELYD